MTWKGIERNGKVRHDMPRKGMQWHFKERNYME
jgi:hypothetical protein